MRRQQAQEITEPRSGIKLLNPQALEHLERPSLVGLDAHRRAAMALAWETAARRLLHSVLLFGWPGTGKTHFPELIAHDLCAADLNCFLITIQCCRVGLSSNVEHMMARLSKVDAIIRSGLYRPTVLLLEEIDALRQNNAPNPATLRLTAWVADLLSLQSRPAGVLVFGVTNDPNRVAPRLLERLHFSMFVDLPDANEAAVLLKHNGIPKPDTVAKALFLRANRVQMGFSGRGLLAGVEYAKLVKGDLSRRQTSEIAPLLMAASGAVHAREFDRYMEENDYWIRRSEAFLGLAEGAYDRLFPGGNATPLP